MTDAPDLTAEESEFLHAVFQTAGGEPDVQVDMYAVGEGLGLDRTASRRTAEILIGWELVEIRTLAGGICLTADGLAFLQGAGLASEPTGGGAPLGTEPVLTGDDALRLERLLADLKARAGERSWHFSALEEFMADLRTLEAQLASPRPKTAVVRACLQSIADNLAECGSRENLARIRHLMG